jgi:hypothetical protein
MEFSYRTTIFSLQNPYFYFAKPQGSAENHLGNTALNLCLENAESDLPGYRFT